MKSICHLTSVHPRFDVRIFLKQCRSLALAGHEVSLVVADGTGDEIKNGVKIFDVGSSRGRLERMFKTTRKVWARAREMDADVYHLHDPELLPVGLKLKKLGKKVIFDAHEDVPRQIMGKHYLNRPARILLSGMLQLYERRACSRLDGIIAATPHIRDKFLSMNANTVDVNNFPIPGELAASSPDWSHKRKQICYLGGIGAVRGIREMVRAMESVASGARLQLGGRFDQACVEQEVKAYPGWNRVDELGFINRQEVARILSVSVAGLVLFHALPNHLDAQPNKMFEYMSAGIPVIASGFPLWREIVEDNDCGVCVDPLKPAEIAGAIDFLVSNPERAEQMGRNGQRAVRERYNWGIEEKKLMGIYEQVMEENI